MSGRPPYIDLLNQKFNRLTVIELVGFSKGAIWRCRCDCGNIKDIPSYSLRKGRVKSCGCFNEEKRSQRFKAKNNPAYKHGRCINTNPKKQRFNRIYKKYRLTENDYEKIKSYQNGKCAICDTEQTRRELVVDHNHRTNVVRGLLCDKCNLLLGHADDSVLKLKKAIEYLNKIHLHEKLDSKNASELSKMVSRTLIGLQGQFDVNNVCEIIDVLFAKYLDLTK